jgi:hypothetical protein
MQDHPELIEITKRLKPLANELRASRGPCPFVVDKQALKRVSLPHYSAGRDATYIHVSRKWNGKLPLTDLSVTIGYAPFVEGTTIIYDLIDEMMQGKARPFLCNLGQQFVRVYMMLPFQIEATDLRIEDPSGGRRLNVAFADARGEKIQAALPFELQIAEADGNPFLTEFCATDREGQFSRNLPSSACCGERVIVRSLLTGRKESLRL